MTISMLVTHSYTCERDCAEYCYVRSVQSIPHPTISHPVFSHNSHRWLGLLSAMHLHFYRPMTIIADSIGYRHVCTPRARESGVVLRFLMYMGSVVHNSVCSNHWNDAGAHAHVSKMIIIVPRSLFRVQFNIVRTVVSCSHQPYICEIFFKLWFKYVFADAWRLVSYLLARNRV